MSETNVMKSFIRVIKNTVYSVFNSFMSNGLSHPYQLDESITVPFLRVVGWSFLFEF